MWFSAPLSVHQSVGLSVTAKCAENHCSLHGRAPGTKNQIDQNQNWRHFWDLVKSGAPESRIFLNFFLFSIDRVLLHQKMFMEVVQSYWAKIWDSGKQWIFLNFSHIWKFESQRSADISGLDACTKTLSDGLRNHFLSFSRVLTVIKKYSKFRL